MVQYITKRLGYGLLVLLGVTLVVFGLFNWLPVKIDPARLSTGQRADVQTVESIRKAYHLDQPDHVRLLLYLNDVSPLSFYNPNNEESLIYLDPKEYKVATQLTLGEQLAFVIKSPYFGRSFQSRRPVSEMISDNIFPTLILALTAILIASFIGIILGVAAAVKHNTWIDNTAVTVSVLGISQPSYVMGIILATVFGYLLADYTGLNVTGNLIEMDKYTGEEYIAWKNLILPAVALGIRPVAIITQLTRSSMLDVLSQDYIRTAKAKGLSTQVVRFKHALRNAMNPVVTSVTGWFASLLAGAFFVELVFSYNGLGMLTINSLLTYDYPVVMGVVLFISVVFVVINLFTDILYGILDPRISVRGK